MVFQFSVRLIYLCMAWIFFPFASYADWVDISNSVEMNYSRAVFDRINRVQYSLVTIKNTSGASIGGDVRLVISESSIPVADLDGSTKDNAQAYMTLDNFLLGNDEEIVIRVNFSLVRGALSFNLSLEKDILIDELDGRAMHGVQFFDTKANHIKVLVPEEYSANSIIISEGLVSNSPHSLITNEFIKITNPKLKAEQFILVKPNSKPKYFLIYDEELQAFERLPYRMKDDGYIEIKTEKDSMTFALTK